MQFDPYLLWLKIPRECRPPTHYDLLGLPAHESDSQSIHQAVLSRTTLVRRHQLGPHAAQALHLLSELALAFDCLSQPDAKAAYDRQLLSTANLNHAAERLSEKGDRPPKSCASINRYAQPPGGPRFRIASEPRHVEIAEAVVVQSSEIVAAAPEEHQAPEPPPIVLNPRRSPAPPHYADVPTRAKAWDCNSAPTAVCHTQARALLQFDLLPLEPSHVDDLIMPCGAACGALLGAVGFPALIAAVSSASWMQVVGMAICGLVPGMMLGSLLAMLVSRLIVAASQLDCCLIRWVIRNHEDRSPIAELLSVVLRIAVFAVILAATLLAVQLF